MKNLVKKHIEKSKKVINLLFKCVNDKSISISKRNKYYSEYLQLQTELLSFKSKYKKYV